MKWLFKRWIKQLLEALAEVLNDITKKEKDIVVKDVGVSIKTKPATPQSGVTVKQQKQQAHDILKGRR